MPPTSYSLYVQNLREGRAVGYNDVVNLAQREATLFGELLGDKAENTMVKNDPESWTLFGRTSGTTTLRNPADPVSFNRNAKSFKAKCGLRMMITPLPSIEYEHDILDGSEDAHWNTMATQEEADQATDHITKADDYVLGVPDLNMESLTDKSMPPHSLITLICPDASISGSTYTPTGLPGNFGATTTIMNLTPSTVPNSRWIPKGEYYGANPFDVDDGVCEHLGRLFDRLKFKKLVPKAGNTHSREVNPKAECCIITGYNGQSIMRRNQYRNNDNHGSDSSFEDVKYRGVVLTVASEWDNQNYDWRTGSPYTSALGSEEPLFLLVNKRDVQVIMHEKHNFRHVMKDMAARQYDVEADILETWWNLRIRRRDTSGFVSPK